MRGMQSRNIIVIGASAGGFGPIKEIVAGLPADLGASIFIVWHMSPDVLGVLPTVLSKLETIPAAHAVDREPIQASRIYVAPPDQHLVVDGGSVHLTRGPRENRFRPAIDPLFRSAAAAHRRRVIGVILSGALDDGTAGLWSVKHYGGMAIVQDPKDAEVPSMPESALRAVDVDHCVPVREMAALLTRLVGEEQVLANNDNANGNELTEIEIAVAMEEKESSSVMEFGELTPYTCPDCHGVLTSLKEGGRIRFRCHTGHAFSANSLLNGITESVEETMWSAIRNIQESVMLLNHMGDHFAEVNQPKLAALYFRKAKESEARANILKEVAVGHENFTATGLEKELEETDSRS